MKFSISFVLVLTCLYGYGQSAIAADRYCILPYNVYLYAGFDKNSIPSVMVDSDFVTLEQVISACVNKYNQEQTAEFERKIIKFPNAGLQLSRFTIDLNEYYRQYMVARNAKGEKEVWINCFCERQRTDYWKKHAVFVFDGGKCYFMLRINLNKKSFSDFIVNAEA